MPDAVSPPSTVLQRLGALHWRWWGIAGYAAGAASYCWYLLSTRDGPFALEITPLGWVLCAMAGGLFGLACAWACRFAIRLLTRRHTTDPKQM